jgi:LDH2 family malate/lactate/ureidoglycolate dehydrogenase
LLFDAATTVVPRGKLEVYKKRGSDMPVGIIVDENGEDCTDPSHVLANIISKAGGGILPLGGSGTATSGYKGYGLGMICEICTAILSGGLTSYYIYRTPGRAYISHCFWAIDYGMFGDKAEIKKNMTVFLKQVRDSEKAKNQERIYIHGEIELESREKVMLEGIPVNEKTFEEMKMIGEHTGADISTLEFRM